MARGRFARDRGSYKASELSALFVFSLIGWMAFWGLCYAISLLIKSTWLAWNWWSSGG